VPRKATRLAVSELGANHGGPLVCFEETRGAKGGSAGLWDTSYKGKGKGSV